jgi:NADPH:quinone reductase-like Zn-dependent oxidoreductase
MKAFVRDRYGSADVLALRDVEMPDLRDDGVLVRVRATSVNAWDWHMLRGVPYMARLSEGLRRPKTPVLGLDVAGVVEAVGANVTDLEPGDEVFGSRTGAFAEYVSGRNLVRKPVGATFEQAAAVPTAGQTALQGVRDKGRVGPGQRVLIIGAGGGVGTFAVQVAKALGADVTAVTRTRSLDVVASTGADHVVDYTREDFARSGRRYDVILDIGGNRSLADLRRALTPDGTLVLVGPGRGQWIGPVKRLVGAAVSDRLGRHRVLPFLATPGREDLLVLQALMDEGQVRPVVDRTYRFEEIPEAIRYVEAGHVTGKVVITM